MKTVIIEVSGGVVQEVYADEGVRIILADWDNRVGDTADNGLGCLMPLSLDEMPDEVKAFIISET